MTVAVQQDAAVENWRPEIRRVPLEEFAQQERLPAQLVGARIARKQIAKLVAKNRRAARLEHHNWDAGVDLWTEMIHHSLQVSLRAVEHAEVVKWTAAAETRARNGHAHARGAQHIERCATRRWMKVIVEGIRPENHVSRRRPRRFVARRWHIRVP